MSIAEAAPVAPEEMIPKSSAEIRADRIRQIEREITIIDSRLECEPDASPNEYNHPLTENKTYTDLLDMLRRRKLELKDLRSGR